MRNGHELLLAGHTLDAAVHEQDDLGRYRPTEEEEAAAMPSASDDG